MRRGVAFLALFFSVIVLACCIVSIIMPWYKVKQSTIVDPDSYVQTLYYWNEFRVTTEKLNATNIIDSGSGVPEDGESYDDKGYDHVKKVFITSLTFTCLATLLTAIAIILVFIAFISKSRIFGIISGVFMLLTFALLIVSLFQFLRINGALRDDDPFCQIGDTLGFNMDKTYCHKFLSNGVEGKLIKIGFGPYVGWYLTIGGIFFSIFAFAPLFSAARK